MLIQDIRLSRLDSGKTLTLAETVLTTGIGKALGVLRGMLIQARRLCEQGIGKNSVLPGAFLQAGGIVGMSLTIGIGGASSS